MAGRKSLSKSVGFERRETATAARLYDADDSGIPVEAPVEAEDALDPIALHHREMQRIACGQLAVREQDCLAALDRREIDRKHLVDDAEDRLERRLYRVAPVDGRVAMQDFLQHLGIRDQLLALAHQRFEQALRVRLVRVRGTDKVHRNVRVDEHHHSPPAP